jgi:L-asparagine transporter-like permease
MVGVAYVFGFGPGPRAAFEIASGHGGLFPKGLSAAFAAIPVVIFSMMGSEVATIAAAETADPARNVARAGRTVSLRILIFYVASIAVIVSVLPWDSVVAGSSPFTRALEAMHIPGAALAISIVAVTAVLSCLNSGLYVTSRMLFELASRGDAPSVFATVSASGVPKTGILVGTAAGFLAAMASIISPNGVFLFLIDTSGAIILFIYLLIALAEVRLRQRLERQGEAVALKMWGFPWLSYAVAGGIALVLASMAVTPGQWVQLALSALSTVITLLAFAARRRLGRRISPAFQG